MADPIITPLAAFGLAMTILNYLLNTIKGLYEKSAEIRDFDSIIGTYINTIGSCRAKYRTWKDIWPDQYHVRVLGVDGSREVNACVSSVENLIAETVRTLRLEPPKIASQASNRTVLGTNTIFKRGWKRLKKSYHSKRESGSHPSYSGLEEGDVEQWQRIAVDFPSQQRFDANSESRRRMLWRVIGILGPNAHLKEQISRLKDNVDSLPAIANGAFRSMGHGVQPNDVNDVVSAANTSDFRNITQTLKGCMSSQGDGKDYFLELHFPSEAGDSRNALDQIVRDCEIRFFARPSPAGPSLARELKMKRLRGVETSDSNGNLKPAPFDLAMSHQTTTLDASMLDLEFRFLWTKQIPTTVTKTWEALLNLCMDDSMFLKSLELERARFARGLVLWFILLWETDWFDHVCACGFRSVDFQSSIDRERAECAQEFARREVVQEFVYHSVLPDCVTSKELQAGSQSPQEAGLPERQASCRGRTSLKHRLYRLGILLAELGHGMPISLDSDLSHDPRIRSPARGKPIGRFKTYDDILNNLPPQLQSAVRFCFDNATERKWVETGGDATCRVSEFLLHVVSPVNEYYEQLRQHAKKISYEVEFKRFRHKDLRKDQSFEQV
jgi:hypothetical protein